MFDRDCDGKINVAEVGTVMRSVGAVPTEGELRQLTQDFSKEGISAVDFDTFLTLLGRFYRADTDKELTDAFRVFDKDGKGFVDAKELRHILTTLGEKLSEKEADQFIREADPTSSGKVSFENFMKVVSIK